MSKFKFFIFIMLIGCASKRNECHISATDILKNNPKTVHAIYNEKNKIIGVSDNSDSGSRGGAYYFYETGELQSYKFFQNSVAYSYNDEFDKSGNIIKHEGAVLVERAIREVNADSAFIKAFFFCLYKDCKKMSISINDSIHFDLPFFPDSLLSNIKTASFGLNTHNLSKIDILFSIQYRNECTGKDTLVMDTTSLVKNPRLNLVPL